MKWLLTIPHSWNDDAEQRAEALVTEACMVAPDSPEPLQTLASVRLSQEKLEDARAALTRSMDIWIDLPPEDPSVPDYPTQISLVRLLMDAAMEEQALEVLERLVDEDDHSVEAWYLGGWCLNVMAEKESADSTAKPGEESAGPDAKTRTLKTSRDWLLKCLKLYGKLEYEDERLKAHADELVAEMNKVLGPPVEGDDDDDDEEWEGIEEDMEDDAQEDEVMKGT
jgi:tetratricopeptide (TPR) repeat protein